MARDSPTEARQIFVRKSPLLGAAWSESAQPPTHGVTSCAPVSCLDVRDPEDTAEGRRRRWGKSVETDSTEPLPQQEASHKVPADLGGGG